MENLLKNNRGTVPFKYREVIFARVGRIRNGLIRTVNTRYKCTLTGSMHGRPGLR
jgi:hypothetical protein